MATGEVLLTADEIAEDPSDEIDSSEYEERWLLDVAVFGVDMWRGDACDGVLNPDCDGGGGLAGGSERSELKKKHSYRKQEEMLLITTQSEMRI